MRIILVVGDNIWGRRLAFELFWQRYAVDYVLYETRRAPLSFWWKKFKRVGPVNFAFQVWLDRWYKRQALKYWKADRKHWGTTIKDVNDYSFEPEDIVIGLGTSYVKASTLKKVKAFLNLHAGVLPEYRGVKSEFWALKNGDDPGWTLHHMASKIDGGNILQLSNLRRWSRNPAIMRCKIIENAVPVLRVMLDGFKRQGVSEGAPQSKGHYYTTPTWRQWREYRRGK